MKILAHLISKKPKKLVNVLENSYEWKPNKVKTTGQDRSKKKIKKFFEKVLPKLIKPLFMPLKILIFSIVPCFERQ